MRTHGITRFTCKFEILKHYCILGYRIEERFATNRELKRYVNIIILAAAARIDLLLAFACHFKQIPFKTPAMFLACAPIAINIFAYSKQHTDKTTTNPFLALKIDIRRPCHRAL